MSAPPTFRHRALCDWPPLYQLAVAARVAAGKNTVLTITTADGRSELFGVYVPPWRDELSRTLLEMAVGLQPLRR